MKAVSPIRARRPSAEVHALILEAAAEVFAEKGYARTTTREIAARAGVAEVLLFRRFGSKAKLFAESALQPMAQFLRDCIQTWAVEPMAEGAEDAIQRDFVERLHTIASTHRGLLLTFFATSVFEPEVVRAGGAGTSIQGALDELASLTEQALVQRGIRLEGFNVPLASRSVIGMVLGMALFGDWLLPAGKQRPAESELFDELTRQVLYGGFNQRPTKRNAPSRADARPPGGRLRRKPHVRSRHP